MDMFPISINADRLDIYSCKYASKFYQLNMFWISINTNMFPISINADRLDIYQVDTTPNSINADRLDIYQVDTTPNSINLICVGYLFSRINSHFYQLDMCWIFIN